jgi:hypothetical protein
MEGQQKTVIVHLRPLKRLAAELLPSDSILRRVLASEPDEMEPRDYVAKLGTWLALLREESSA